MQSYGLGPPLPTILPNNHIEERRCCCFPWRRRVIRHENVIKTDEKISKMSPREKLALVELAKTWGNS